VSEVQSQALARLLELRADAVLSHHERLGDATAVVHADRIVEVMQFFKQTEGLEFDMLADLTCVDFLGREPRFEMVYHLYSVKRNHRIRIKAGVPEDPCEIDSVKGVWPTAGWLEREVWDMYGVRFRNHGDMRRLLLYEEFEGHPLRKDYPKEKRQPLIGPRN
jgi:NADH-quinone oxidoreductase subunit C